MADSPCPRGPRRREALRRDARPRRVSLALGEGEILALLGDNGAGKSTLIKILSGVVKPDAGEILIDGEAVSIGSPHHARELGIETVYQDLALFDNFDATGNFYAGREPVKPGWLGALGWVKDRSMTRETGELLDRLQVNIARGDEIGLMSGGQRQAVACARAIAFGQRIVILDEPTSALGARESGNVLRLIAEAPESGVSVILISHNLEHVMEVAHRAVVLRQGRYVGEETPDAEHHERLVSDDRGQRGGGGWRRGLGLGLRARAVRAAGRRRPRRARHDAPPRVPGRAARCGRVGAQRLRRPARPGHGQGAADRVRPEVAQPGVLGQHPPRRGGRRPAGAREGRDARRRSPTRRSPSRSTSSRTCSRRRSTRSSSPPTTPISSSRCSRRRRSASRSYCSTRRSRAGSPRRPTSGRRTSGRDRDGPLPEEGRAARARSRSSAASPARRSTSTASTGSRRA